ncbi:MAG: S41 family peptidase [Bacteroidetes bacterium]|nr:S41 family peptidase [Bacteroidota bacterium]
MRHIIKNRSKVIIIVSVIVAFTLGFSVADSDYFFKVNKSIDVFGRVFKEITFNYVDEIDPEVFMNTGIEGMLKSLDPYTNFISASEVSDVDLITTGRYGGIGITISMRDGMIVITSLMEGYTAQKQGLRIGDKIIEVDGKSLLNVKLEDMRHLTRGEPGTEVRVKVQREGEQKPLDFDLIREEIKLKNISYSNLIQNEIALIKLDRFTRTAGDEFRLAVKELRLKGEIKGIILDLRDNPGGLLDAAVNITSKFVPKGSLVVSTRGRKTGSEQKYFSVEGPILHEIPVAVLINKNSASASEIVAGAIQDLDRGIIIGSRTFGKGLVQNVVPLPYNNQLKLTTAKYYTPSGRCIQEIDYIHKDKDGLFTITPDSLKKNFFTTKGRKVQELGGIHPDTTLLELEPSLLYLELMRKAMFFKFATHYVSTHRELPEDFSANGDLCTQFKNYVRENKFTYEDQVETKVEEVRNLAEKSNYGKEIIDGIQALKLKIATHKENAFEENQKELVRQLRQEIYSRYKGEQGRIEASYMDDNQVQVAVGIIRNNNLYKKILNIQ